MKRYVNCEARWTYIVLGLWICLFGIGSPLALGTLLGYVRASNARIEGVTASIILILVLWIVMLAVAMPGFWNMFFSSAAFLSVDDTGITRRIPLCFRYQLRWEDVAQCGIIHITSKRHRADHLVFAPAQLPEQLFKAEHSVGFFILRGMIVIRVDSRKKLAQLAAMCEEHGVELHDYRKYPTMY